MTMLLWKSASRVRFVRPSVLGMVLSLLSAAFSSVRLTRLPIVGGSLMILLLKALISVSDVIVPRLSGRPDISFLYRCSLLRDTSSPTSSGIRLILLSLASSVWRFTRRRSSLGSSVSWFSEQFKAVSVRILPSPGGMVVSLFWIMLRSFVSLAAACSRCEERNPPGTASRASTPSLERLESVEEEHPMVAVAVEPSCCGIGALVRRRLPLSPPRRRRPL
mmetsp:Transcript_6681/g.16122  ORF Transcript_6681/g.16122 Transcript_6681/m.16122 type:complete len:220 (-) Transcript_6681:30-689(-)